MASLARDYDDNYYEYAYPSSSFEQAYRCYPLSSIRKKEHLEKGDKIVMPPSALSWFASLHIDYPLLFELRNAAAERISHCSVMRFVADEGTIVLPRWMMENMRLKQGDVVHVKNASLSKGTYAKFQPHSKDFLDISNPKALLETALRNFSCLTTGDTIVVPYNNKKYHIDIIETKPSDAISIVETDCEVEFAPPLDYVEPVKPAVAPSVKAHNEEETTKEDFKFMAFTGVARRLDGKPSLCPTSPILKSHQPELVSNTSLHKHSGTLVYGSNVGRPQPSKPASKVLEKETNLKSQKVDKNNFQAFTGKGYSLKG